MSKQDFNGSTGTANANSKRFAWRPAGFVRKGIEKMSIESFWNMVVSELRREPQEIQTIRKNGGAGLWFSASVEDGMIVIDNALANRPSTEITVPRFIGRDEFDRIYPHYESWLAGEYPRHIIRDIMGKNSSYVLGIIHYFKNRADKSVTSGCDHNGAECNKRRHILLCAVITALAIFTVEKAEAQNMPDSYKGTVFINAGVDGTGLLSLLLYDTVKIPPVSASIDFKLPTLPLTLGGSATFGNVLTYIYQTRSSPDYLYHIFRSRFNFDIRAATIYSEDVANLYLGIKFGYAIEGTADFELIRKPENQPDPEYEREGSSFFHWGIYWGWRIFFTKNIGWYGELGYDNIWELLGILCTGITLKF